MYGTVTVGHLAVPFEQFERVGKQWEAERGNKVEGFLGEDVLRCDDQRTVVIAVRFTDRNAYKRLGDDPLQDEWWRTQMAPCLDGEVQWFDGDWVSATD
jgi:hypothetical protein